MVRSNKFYYLSVCLFFANNPILLNNQYEKFCLIFGFGGHGLGCLIDHFRNESTEFSIVLIPMDDGGCTGRMQKYFKKAIQDIKSFGAGNFNNDKDPIALGDLKNNIKVWLSIIATK